jgi:putative transposase
VVTAASGQERDGAKSPRGGRRHPCSRLRRIWADQADAGALVEWVRGWRVHRPVPLEVVPRSTAAKGFTVLPKRWIGARTLGWFNRYRRVSKDDELLPETRETIIRVAMIQIMVRRLARIAPY